MNTFQKTAFHRVVSALLVIIMMVSLVPIDLFAVSAEAAEGTITPPQKTNISKLDFCNGVNGKYPSPNISPNPQVHIFTVTEPKTVAGKPMTAFCMDHSGSLGSLVKTGWNLVGEKDMGAAAAYLSNYYWALDSGALPAHELEILNAMTQAAVWMQLTGKLNGSENDYAKLGKERAALSKYYYGYEPENDVTPSTEFMRMIGEEYKTGKYGSWKFYEYKYSKKSPYNNPVQHLLIGVPDGTTITGYHFYLTLDKLDETGVPLAGAEFTVYSDAACTKKMYSFLTEAVSGKAYGSINMEPATATEMDVWVKETAAPSGYEISAEAAAPTQVHVTTGNTKDNPAVVGSGSFKNAPDGGDDDDDGDDDVLRKIDAKTGLGVGGAEFLIRGETFPDEIPTAAGKPTADPAVKYIERTVVTDEAGNYHYQWSDPSDLATYLPPGQYTVTEIKPPAGYEAGSTPSEAHLVLHYDIQNKTCTSSGSLVFANNPLHRVVIEKRDASGKGLPGAIFEIYRDGLLVATEKTDEEGVISYSGDDGKGVPSGLYRITEIAAPEGYLLPSESHRTQWIKVDASDWNVTKHTVSFRNYKYPDIIIKKKSRGTDEGLVGGLFEVQIDGTVLDTYITNPGGEIVISHDVYGRFLTEGKESWTITVTELVAPEGYFIDYPNVQTAELREGETLKEFTFTDTKYPEFKLYKYANGTREPLEGAVFEIAIDGVSFCTKPTNINGEIHITYADYKDYIKNDQSESWTFTAREIEAPDGYLIDDASWHILEMNKGQSLGEMTFTDTKYPEIVILL